MKVVDVCTGNQIFLYLFVFAIRAWLGPDVYKASMNKQLFPF